MRTSITKCVEALLTCSARHTLSSTMHKRGDKLMTFPWFFFVSMLLTLCVVSQVLMSASRFRQGISSDRILRAFEFLRRRLDEADEVVRQEAEEARKSAQSPASQDAPDTPGPVESGSARPGGSWSSAKLVLTPQQKREAEAREKKRTEERTRAMNRGKIMSSQKRTQLPVVGKAGLVALMGDLDSLQQRVQGGWKLVVRAGDG